MDEDSRPGVDHFRQRVERTLDAEREDARNIRHDKGCRTARENLHDLVDEHSFQEYGQLAVAAQRSRRDYEELQSNTAGDGIITGTATINAELVGSAQLRPAPRGWDMSVPGTIQERAYTFPIWYSPR